MKTTVLTNIYNEEYLLPFWLEHHKKIFDHGIIIDYWSTDKSVEICKQICPTWEVRTTKNPHFGAIEIDQEFMEIEASLEGIKVVLNTTEFLYVTKPLQEIFSESITPEEPLLSLSACAYGPYSMVEENPTSLLELHTCLLQEDVRYEFQYYRGRRQVHNHPTGNYGLGRHSTRNTCFETQKLAIVWLGYYPWNQKLIDRKLQVKTHIPESDKHQGYSWHHFHDLAKLEQTRIDRYNCSKTLEEECPHVYKMLLESISKF